jgi:hypothetical protein
MKWNVFNKLSFMCGAFIVNVKLLKEQCEQPIVEDKFD